MLKEESKSILDSFMSNRKIFIDIYQKGEISKKEYIEKNYDYIKKNAIAPFQTIDSVEKGLLNYQYYNIFAKYLSIIAAEEKDKYKDIKFYRKYLDECNYYYDEKDKTTFRILRLINYKNVEAYYIKMLSETLNNSLFEINLKEYHYAVLHSRSIWLKNALTDKGVFLEEQRESLINHYVNVKY